MNLNTKRSITTAALGGLLIFGAAWPAQAGGSGYRTIDPSHNSSGSSRGAASHLRGNFNSGGGSSYGLKIHRGSARPSIPTSGKTSYYNAQPRIKHKGDPQLYERFDYEGALYQVGPTGNFARRNFSSQTPKLGKGTIE